jgi:hypothetical protein
MLFQGKEIYSASLFSPLENNGAEYFEQKECLLWKILPYHPQGMAKSVTFRVGTVKLTISFDTVEELKTALGQVEDIKKVLKESLPEASTEPSKTVRKELEPFFDYEGGKLVMSRPPPTNIKKVCLALYALNADGAFPKEIGDLSRVQNPSNSVMHAPIYEKYFKQLKNGKYVLTDAGYSFVANEILTKPKEEKQDAET